MGLSLSLSLSSARVCVCACGEIFLVSTSHAYRTYTRARAHRAPTHERAQSLRAKGGSSSGFARGCGVFELELFFVARSTAFLVLPLSCVSARCHFSFVSLGGLSSQAGGEWRL